MHLLAAAGTQKSRTGTRTFEGWHGYAFMLVMITVAFLIRYLFDPLWEDRLPFGWFFLALLITARWAASGPQLLALFLGLLLGDLFFMSPRGQLGLETANDQINAIIYTCIGLTVVILARQARESMAKGAQLASIVESSNDAIIGQSADGTILTWNAAAERLYGFLPGEIVGRSFAMLFSPDRLEDFQKILARVAHGERVSHFETQQQAKNGAPLDVSLTVSPVQNIGTQKVEISITARDVSQQKRAQAEREELIRQLTAALAEVKTLTGLLPICSGCKKIRDLEGSWNQLEVYIRDRSNAEFTHGICPDCYRRLYPDFDLPAAKP